MLLKVMKLFDEKLEMTDVSRDVFEILEVTGFSELLSVKKALTEIDITGKEIIGRGAFGTAYRLDDERIVKVYRGDLGLDYIEREQRFAKAPLSVEYRPLCPLTLSKLAIATVSYLKQLIRIRLPGL